MVDYNTLYNQTKDLKVLYIEDDTNFQTETCIILEYFFITVHSAVDGEDGLEKYLDFYNQNNRYYDLVITDINMPNKNGIELCRDIYIHNQKQSIVVLSAHNESNYLLELLNMGIEQFLQKPINYDNLTKVLYNISNKQHLPNNTNQKIVNFNNNYSWDIEQSILFNGKKVIALTKKEIQLMHLFIKNNQKVTTNEEILNMLWDDEYQTTRENIMPIISRFRKKLPNQEIENIYAMGYRLNF